MALVKRQEVNYGDFNSTKAGAGIALGPRRTAVRRAYADDGGVALAACSVRSFLGRFLMTTDTANDVSVNGLQGHLKVGANYSGPGNKAGVWGYCEVVAGKTVGPGHGGVTSIVDLPATAVIGSGNILAAYRAFSNTLGGTHTGKAVVMEVPNPLAGTWDAMFAFGAAPGAIVDQSGGTLTITKKIPVLLSDGSTVYIAVGTIG